MATMTSSERPLLESEKRLLRCALANQRKRLRDLRRRILIIGGTIVAILWGVTLADSKNGPSWYVSGLFWLAIGVLLGFWCYWDARRDILRVLNRFESATRRNQARVVQVQSEQMVEFEEQEDEGACYAFQADPDRVVFVAGQAFYADRRFPNSDFSLVDVLTEDDTVAMFLIAKRGTKIEPIRTIPVEVRSKLKVPRHLEAVEGSLDRLEQLLAMNEAGTVKHRQTSNLQEGRWK